MIMAIMRVLARSGVALALATAGAAAVAASKADNFTLPQALAFPFVSDLVTDRAGTRMAWVRISGGVRNIWVADAPRFTPRQVTRFTADDGEELTQLVFSPDGRMLVFVRGGDHDSNFAGEGNRPPNPTSGPATPKVMLWRADPSGTAPAVAITEGDAPAISAQGVLAFVRNGEVWTAPLTGGGEPARLFYDRGSDQSLVWSPDGSRLAFVSDRKDHSFIGVFATATAPLTWLAPSTGRDDAPVWSPDGRRIAFTRRPGVGGPPGPLLERTPQPWAIWTADAATGAGTRVWKSGAGLRDSVPDVAGGANLMWAAGDRLTFLSMADNWPHLYAVPIAGGTPEQLTRGDFMVEHVAISPDRTTLIYSANTGNAADDGERRHIFRVGVTGGASTALTAGDGLEWTPVGLANGTGFIGAGARTPLAVGIVSPGGSRRDLPGQTVAADFAGAQFVVPKAVTFTAPDGLVIHGQLFEAPGGSAPRPGIIFAHGGPPRQMMLGFSYMRYYANAYAMNQYLAAQGFAVLSVNYRLGIGYGWDFQHPAKAGQAGSSEYQDILAGGRFLAGRPGIDGNRIGVWGGSYGGLLTALALARNSDLFKAGVDIHGVHDFSRSRAENLGPRTWRFEQGDKEAAMETAFKASPVADVATWKSPVLLIHGDDDRNVRVNQTIDLARRLDTAGVEHEELILPDEIHDFLRHASWLRVFDASADFLTRKLKP